MEIRINGQSMDGWMDGFTLVDRFSTLYMIYMKNAHILYQYYL